MQQVMELHGGKITVKSRPGKGSAFTLTLPLCESEDTTENETGVSIGFVTDDFRYSIVLFK